MSAPAQDDLERRLTELFGQRAATVTQVRQFDLGPADNRRKVVRLVPGRGLHPRWRNVGVLAAAAAVFIVVVGTILAIQANRPRPAPPLGTPTASPTSSSCSAPAPADWQRAIDAGAFAVNEPFNAVVSANGGTGDYLALQGKEPADQNSQIYSDLTAVLYHGTRGSTIYTTEGSKDFVQADPTGAISAGWVTFAVAYPQGADFGYQVMLYQRDANSMRTLAGAAGQPDPGHKLVLGPPVIAAGKVYWLAQVGNRPETTTLESWDLSRNSAAGSVAAAGATGLVSYGSGVALLHESVSGTSETSPGLSNGAGAPLAAAQLDATAGGTNFGFDGTSKLSWLRHDGNLVGYASLVVGGTGVNYEPLTRQFPGFRAAIFPFTDAILDSSEAGTSTSAVLDLRTGAAVRLPAGVSLHAVVGNNVVFGTGDHSSGAAFGSAGLSLVPLSALAPVQC